MLEKFYPLSRTKRSWFTIVFGFWFLVFGFWFLVFGCYYEENGSFVLISIYLDQNKKVDFHLNILFLSNFQTAWTHTHTNRHGHIHIQTAWTHTHTNSMDTDTYKQHGHRHIQTAWTHTNSMDTYTYKQHGHINIETIYSFYSFSSYKSRLHSNKRHPLYKTSLHYLILKGQRILFLKYIF